jgi:hypothetical protein
MLKLGDYYEDEAKSIANSLRDAGIKVEQKAFLNARVEIPRGQAKRA